MFTTLPKSIFPDPLQVEMLHMQGGRRLWKMHHRFRARTSWGEIEVPEDFITDLASVPRILWVAASPSDEYLPATIPHDFLYSELNTKYTRRESDDIMLELMFNLGVSWPRRHAVHSAVRAGGWRTYKGLKP